MKLLFNNGTIKNADQVQMKIGIFNCFLCANFHHKRTWVINKNIPIMLEHLKTLTLAKMDLVTVT